MKNKNLPQNVIKNLNFALLILSLLSMSLVPAPQNAAPQAAAPSTGLVQFKTGGHILGFQPQQVYFAAMDHMLSVEFLGTPGVAPQQGQDAVTYANLWRGVSVTYQTAAEGIAKTTYTLAPGANPRQIRLRYNQPVALQDDGSLRVGGLEDQAGYMTESAPIAWQEIDGQRVAVDVAFVVRERGAWADAIRPYGVGVGAQGLRPEGMHQEVSFQVGRYDRRYALVIDPTYAWHTFYGSKPTFEGIAITADDSGNVYLVGNASSEFYYNNFSASPKLGYHGGNDIVAIKFDAFGTAQWHTFLGGEYQDYGTGVAVGSAVYVVGYSTATWDGRDYSGFPLSPLHAFTPGYSDAVIISLSSSSGTMNWHTFYGSDNIDSAQGVTVLSDNSLVVAGSSYDTWKGPADQNPLHAFTGQYDISDIMALRLNSSGAYLWHTFYGSTSDDVGRAISRSTSDNIYIAGNSLGSWNAGATAPLHAHSGDSDITVLSLTSAGGYNWHTFYGSSGSDAATALLVDNSRSRVYVAGYSSASWLGDGSAAALHGHSGGSEIVALALGTAGGYNWHTFYGSDRSDEAFGIALIPIGMGSIVLVGRSEKSWNGPAPANLPEHAYTGGWDSFALRIYYDGAYEWHTFYGSTARESATAAVYQSTAGLVLTGYGEETWPDYDTVKHYSGQNILRLSLATGTGDYSSHKFYGTFEGETISGLATGSDGSVVLVGSTEASWLGAGNVAPKHAYSGGSGADIAILKLDQNGAYLWHTFYGAKNSNDLGSDVSVDGSGNVYVAATSRASWLGDGSTPPRNAYQNLNDTVVLKLNSSGVYQWHTFLGSSTGNDGALDILVSGTMVFVCGSSSVSFLGPGSKAPLNGHSGGGEDDTLIFKLNSSGDFLWHTFYGATGIDDQGLGMVLDSYGYLYITGDGGSWNGPGGVMPFNLDDGEDDIYVLKLDSNGDYTWHTFYGDGDSVSIGIDAQQNLVVTGYAYQTWNGYNNAAPRHAYTAMRDIFALKMTYNGDYLWHTFMGGSNEEFADALAVSRDGMIYIAGYSYAWDGPAGQLPSHAHSGNLDAFILALMPDGDYLWHTFYGSTGVDKALALGLDSQNRLFVGGVAALTWKGNGGTNPLHAHSTSGDIFALRLDNPVYRLYAPLVKK